VLALGTGNDAANLLGLGTDDALVDAVLGGGERPLDLIEVRLRENGAERVRHAVLFVAVGFSGDLLGATTPAIKRWFGAKLSYPIGFFRALADHRPVRLRVRTGRGDVDEPLVVALMANAPHAGGGMMRIAPGADMGDGLGEVSLIRGLGRWRIAGQFLRLVRGTHVNHPNVEHFADVAMEVSADPAQGVALDGDLVGMTPMHARMRKGAVRVVARGA
jgi:diacylglycerol kinase (ATP)